MRISSRQLLEASQQSMQKSSVDTANWQQRISSGQRYERASQNPAAASRAVELATRQSRIDSLKANQNAVENSMSEIDSQITGIRQAMASLTEVGVQARNGAIGATGLVAMAQTATQTVDLLKSLVNANNAAGTPMFGETVVELEIEPDFKLPMNLTRTDVFGEGAKGVETVMAAAQAIVDALASGKAPSLDEMTALDKATATLMAAQVKGGLVLGQIEASRSVMVASTDNLVRERGTLLETDILESASELTRSQTQLEAARNIFARLDATGLFKKL